MGPKRALATDVSLSSFLIASVARTLDVLGCPANDGPRCLRSGGKVVRQGHRPDADNTGDPQHGQCQRSLMSALSLLLFCLPPHYLPTTSPQGCCYRLHLSDYMFIVLLYSVETKTVQLIPGSIYEYLLMSQSDRIILIPPL